MKRLLPRIVLLLAIAALMGTSPRPSIPFVFRAGPLDVEGSKAKVAGSLSRKAVKHTRNVTLDLRATLPEQVSASDGGSVTTLVMELDPGSPLEALHAAVPESAFRATSTGSVAEIPTSLKCGDVKESCDFTARVRVDGYEGPWRLEAVLEAHEMHTCHSKGIFREECGELRGDVSIRLE